MKIYTKTGDSGETRLFAGPRVRKDDQRIEAYGTIDELNAVLGLARSAQSDSPLDHVLSRIQSDLFRIGAELATLDSSKLATVPISQGDIEELESDIDDLDSQLRPLTQFILPVGVPMAATIHVARTVCRRAERRVVTLANSCETVSEPVVAYINRLSDLLFVMARAANHFAGQDDTIWNN